ncbi:MAG TPA: hypothetical protein VGF65_11245 [Mycobacterium sp.]|jgi:hypothetical protein
MALDFPASPTNGQTFAGPGGVVYQWDGSKWIVLPGSGGGAMLPITGGTLQGPLILAADPLPTAPLGAATKQYADAGVASAEHNVGRSYIHNGLFNVQQRGTGAWTTNGIYTADRWITTFGAGDANSVAIVAVADSNRAQIGDEAAQSMLLNQFTGASGAANYVLLIQSIENVRRLANKTVTVSFFAVASAAGMKIGVSLDQSFGTGGSPSAAVLGNGQAVTLTTAFARYSLTFTLPSIAGKTLGTNGNDATGLDLWLSSGSNFAARSGNVGVQSGNIWLWGIQLELGAAATPLEKLDPRVDLANAQRFYQSYSAPPLRGSASPSVATVSRMGMLLPVPMRAIPSVAITAPIGVYNGSQANTITSIAANYSTNFAIEIDGVTSAAWGAQVGAIYPAMAYQGGGGTLTASADL